MQVFTKLLIIRHASLGYILKPKNNRIFRKFYDFKNPLAEIEKMPRNKKDIEVLREMRLKNKKLSKSTRFPPGEIYLCVLGNGSISSARALYMFTDHERYLFNCGEGTQRLAAEHKTKMSKLDHIFITHNSWENTGGLPGMALTLQDMGVPEISLHGPPKLDFLYEYTRSFAVYKTLNIKTRDYNNSKFSDDCMEVEYIPIFADSSISESYSDSSDLDSSDNSCEESDSCEDITEPKFKKLCQSPTNTSKNAYMDKDVTVAFACKGHSKPGHLLYDKCVDLGVPPGPLLGELKNGKDVTLPSGKVVHSKDVVSEEQQCPLFLVVECPSMKFLHSFVKENKFHQYQNSLNPSKIASLVVHFTPSNILHNSAYQEWMRKFPYSTCHLILNDENATLNSAAVHRIQHKLNMIHPKIFSLLHEKEVSKKWTDPQMQNVVQANTLERYYLRPSNGIDRRTALQFNVEEFINEAKQINGFESSLENLKNYINQSSTLNAHDNCYPVTTFLGTGSSIPCKARNVSAILVNANENGYILLDCGEGTYGQLLRLCGPKSDKVLKQLFCVFISHIHADHHLGLIKILIAREEVYKRYNKKSEPVTIIGPRMLKVWLKNYSKFIEHLNRYTFIECSTLEHSMFLKKQNIFETCQDIEISTVPVNHCPDAHGVIITQNSAKWKLVYSGDTLPCERLVTAGKNCSILIHEATMEDELKEEAVIKRHSTTSEAIKIGTDMESDYTVLTHFSQRYAKIPLFNENFHNHIGCAFDNMTVSLNMLYILPLLIPTLKCLFAEDVEEMNIKGDKRRNKIKSINPSIIESVANNV